MRILYLIKADQFGGAEKQLLDIIKHFENKFEQIAVASFKGKLKKKLTGLNVNYYELRNQYGPITTVFNFNTICNIINNNDINVIHYFHRTYLPIIFLIKLKFFKIKIIYSATSIFYDLKGYFIFADHYLAVSESVRNNLINFYKKNSSKVLTLYHGINLDEYTFNTSNYLNNDNDILMLGYAGRIEKSKGIKYLIYLMKELKNYNIRLIIQGDGKQKEFLKNLAIKNEVDNIISFKKWDDNISKFLNQIDVFILPSIKHEGFGLILLEALASGKIVIASKIGGITNIIKNDENGFLFKPKDINELKYFVLNIYNKNIDIKKLNEAILNQLENFKLANILNEYENFYFNKF